MIFLKLGFRNLARNKRRSILAALAVGIGLASLILADGFWAGMTKNMISTVTSTYIGHAQIHHDKFQETYESVYRLQNIQELKELLLKDSDVQAITARTLSIGMISSSQDSLNINIVGIEPINEKKISKFHQRMILGNYVKNETDLMIGERLRQRLNVILGDRIVITLSEPKTGEIKQELFRLTGVFTMGSKEMDEGMAIIHQERLQKLLGLSDGHEIAIKFHHVEQTEMKASQIKTKMSKNIKLETWKELVPQIVAAIGMSSMSMSILGIVLFSLVALGILNTILMSLFERKHEFGVMRALGTKNREVLLIILSEAFALSIVSVAFGIMLALIIGGWMMKFGIDYSGIEFGEITFTEKIYFIFSLHQFFLYPFLLIIFTLLITLYPVYKTLKIKPANALKRSM